MTVSKRKLLELCTRFFEVRNVIKASMGDVSPVPLNVLQVGPAGFMAVAGKDDNLSLVFYDFTKSKEHYAELTEGTVEMNVGVRSELIATALICTTASLEWWIKIPGEEALPSFLRKS